MGSTKALRQFQNAARKDAGLREAFGAAEATLAAALADYHRSAAASAAKESQPAPTSVSSSSAGLPLRCGVGSFLDSPDMASVNAYELRARLRHICARLRAMVDAASGMANGPRA